MQPIQFGNLPVPWIAPMWFPRFLNIMGLEVSGVIIEVEVKVMSPGECRLLWHHCSKCVIRRADELTFIKDLILDLQVMIMLTRVSLDGISCCKYLILERINIEYTLVKPWLFHQLNRTGIPNTGRKRLQPAMPNTWRKSTSKKRM